MDELEAKRKYYSAQSDYYDIYVESCLKQLTKRPEYVPTQPLLT